MHIAEASVEHDLLMNSYLQTNKDNHSHLDSLCLAAHKVHVNEKKEKRKKDEIKKNKRAKPFKIPTENYSYKITPTKNPNSPNKQNPLKLKPFTLQIHSNYQ